VTLSVVPLNDRPVPSEIVTGDAELPVGLPSSVEAPMFAICDSVIQPAGMLLSV
jgi:hypothetical protein